MPLTRRSLPLLATVALLLSPVVARAADSKLSPTPPPGMPQGPGPTRVLPHTGTDLGLEAAAAAVLIAGGTLLRAPRYFGRR
jgi:hypothetical protein